MIIGYARVSTTEQSLDIQIAALKEAGAEQIFSEKLSGTTANRPELLRAIEFARAGDTLLVTRLDRFARSTGDLYRLLEQLESKGVMFRAVEQSAANTTSATGKLMLAILGAVATFENDLRKDRQREGIEAAKTKGVYKGRKATIDREQVIELVNAGVSKAEIARRLGVAKSSVFRVIDEMKAG